MAVSTPIRHLSLALLILTVAPWASLWALVVTLQFKNASLLFVSTLTVEGKDAPALSSILNNENVTLEELWLALFQDRWLSRPTPPSEGVDAYYFLPSLPAAYTASHWTVVLPWVISLLLGLLVPLLAALSAYGMGRRVPRNANGMGHNEDPWISRFCRNERRLSRLLATAKDFRKMLSEKDMDPSDLDFEKHPKWRVPLPGYPVYCQETRSVVGTCSVCLANYASGDRVIWSPNPVCSHVFHEDCILSWLLRRHRQCPCCRQPFLLSPRSK